MREIKINRENLAGLRGEQVETLKAAIARAESTRREEWEKPDWNQKIQRENIWIRATCMAADRVHRIPVAEEVSAYWDRAAVEIQLSKEKNDWYYAVHILENVFRFGVQTTRVPDDYVTPWPLEGVVISIETHRPDAPPLVRKVAASAGNVPVSRLA